MKIAVLSWGSLTWDSGVLDIDGDWQEDGPFLPIEYARISKSRNGALTLVLYPGGMKVQVLWAIMKAKVLDKARENLRAREHASSVDNIGFVDFNNKWHSQVNSIVDDIKQWKGNRDLDVVIWTDLESNFQSCSKLKLNKTNVIKYLKNLPDDAKQKAEEYIRRTPKQIKTVFRKAIEEELGWTPLDT